MAERISKIGSEFVQDWFALEQIILDQDWFGPEQIILVQDWFGHRTLPAGKLV